MQALTTSAATPSGIELNVLTARFEYALPCVYPAACGRASPSGGVRLGWFRCLVAQTAGEGWAGAWAGA